MSADKYFSAALKGICDEVRVTNPGCQTRKLYEAAYRLGRLVIESDLDAFWFDAIESSLIESGLEMPNAPTREPWTEAAIRKQVLSGIRDAKRKGGGAHAPETPQKAVQPVSGVAAQDLPIQQTELRRHSYCVDGSPVMIKVRYEGEPKYRPFYLDTRPDGTAFWNVHKPADFRYVPYGLDLLKASQGRRIYLTEGERDADTLLALGLCATTFGSAGFWPDGAEMYFTGRDVVVIGDNDDAGHKHIEAITQKLTGVARSVESWTPKGGPPGYDVTDWIQTHPSGDILNAISSEQLPHSTSNVVALVTGLTAQALTEPVVVMSESKPNTPLSRFRPQLITADDDLGEQEWLVDGVLPRRGYALIFGASGLGKSFIGVDLALAVKNGRPWGGRDVRQGEVIYIAAEDPFGLHARVCDQLRASGDELEGFHIIKEPPNLSGSSQDVDEIILAIREVTAGMNPALVIIDTFQRVAGGTDENHASEVMGIVRNVDKISRAFDCLVTMIHHVGRQASGPRGSAVFKDAADAAIEIKESGGKRTLRLEKLRNGPDGLKAIFDLEAITGSDGPRVRFLCDWGDATESPTKRNLDKGQSRQIQMAVIEVLRLHQAETGQAQLTREELRKHNLIIACLARHTKKKSADTALGRAIKDLAKAGKITGDAKTITLVSPSNGDMSPPVASVSPIAA